MFVATPYSSHLNLIIRMFFHFKSRFYLFKIMLDHKKGRSYTRMILTGSNDVYNTICSIYTVPTNEIGTLYIFRPLLTRRLMALRIFSFYFLISNLVAVILRFLEGGSKQNWEQEKSTTSPPPLYVHFPTPWNWRHVYHFRRAKVGAVAVLFLWRYQKRSLFFKNH
jgi:hypothetical protein